MADVPQKKVPNAVLARPIAKNAAPQRPAAPARPPIRPYILIGMTVILIFFGGFGSWAVVAPLASAAMAPGQVTVESNRKTVQHLEGGIIRELLVREGDGVEAGQLLIKLETTRSDAQVDALNHERMSLIADLARLNAHAHSENTIKFPSELLERQDDSRVAEILRSQEELFSTANRSREGQRSILEQQIQQYEQQIIGLNEQITAFDRQIELIGQELADVQKLFDKGLTRKPRLLELQRGMADLRGDRADSRARIAQVQEAIGETRIRIIALDDEIAERTAEEVEENQKRLVEIQESLKSADDILGRLDIRAPIAGKVVNLKFFTPGGVIPPGEQILDIVPQEDNLVIRVRIDPMDIDVVHEGMIAEVQLTAFSQRTTPSLEGELIQVSADRIDDLQGQTSYYEGMVAIEPDAINELEDIELYPGMPAEVMIKLGERTFLDYLLAPLTSSFNHAFRES
ncbi:MAG: HlyD family type I secretion periplasmic adaptor subunit [Cyanobacteria bacterium J06638_22]